MAIHDVLIQLVRGETLSSEGTEHLFDEILGGRADDAQIGAALALIQVRGVGVEQLLGGARSMRRHAITVPTDGISGVIIDTCGTGGAAKTFNVSSVAAIVAAAAGEGAVRVAKHGNRSRTGRGSAEVLGQLGVNVDTPVATQARCLREAGVCFCFAVHHHPAAKFAAAARRSLAFPTIFNLLGPLCNPARAACQLIGVFDSRYVEPMGRTLAALGTRSAMIVHGQDGMDEFSTTGPTLVGVVKDGAVHTEVRDAAEFGVPRSSLADLAASDLADSARIAAGVIGGSVRGACRDIVTLNAGLALQIAGVVDTVEEGIVRCEGAIDSGVASRTLGVLARISREGAGG